MGDITECEEKLMETFEKLSRKAVDVEEMKKWITSVANVKCKGKLADKAEEYARLIVDEADYSQEGEIAALTTDVLLRLGLKDAHAKILGEFLGSAAKKAAPLEPEVVHNKRLISQEILALRKALSRWRTTASRGQQHKFRTAWQKR